MIAFLRRHPYILSFGIFQIFFSAPGQTFLISLFVLPVFNDLGVSQSLFAGLYSGATLLAALLLNPAGRLIDKHSPRSIVTTVCFLMAFGCLTLAGSRNLVTLFIGFFVLRLIGQGVFGLIASTLIIKQFHKNRGKAMGAITLGFPFSEAVYPFLAIFLLSKFDWRVSYVLFAFSNIVLMLPLQLFLLKRSNIRIGKFQPGEMDINPQHLPGNPQERAVRPHKDFTLKQAIHDNKFFLILAASCLPPMVVTGLFFHQQSLFIANGWAIEYAAAGLAAYAIAKAVGSVGIGPVVDKHGPMPLFTTIILLLGMGTYVATLGGQTYVIYAYFVLIGAALGFSSPVMNVVWPYFYGVKHMGSIKGFIATFRNGLTAFGPLPVAIALDAGISILTVLRWLSLGIICMASIPFIVSSLDRAENRLAA